MEIEKREIPKRLQNPNFRFCLVCGVGATHDATHPFKKGNKCTSQGKTPIEAKWQEMVNYRHDDAKLQTHLSAGGNVGLVCGIGDVVCVDADSPDIRALVEGNGLGETYCETTGRNGNRHYYYIVSGGMKTVGLNDEQGNQGHIKANRSQVVIPPSMHKSGKPYAAEKDLPLMKIEEAQLLDVFRDFAVGCARKVQTTNITAAAKALGGHFELPINHVINLSTLRKTGEWYRGSHPVHGSSTDDNFSVNPQLGMWHCFRHEVGGDVLSLVGVIKGLIACKDANKKLRGETFKTVLKIAKGEYGLTERIMSQPNVMQSVGQPAAMKSVPAALEPNQLELDLLQDSQLFDKMLAELSKKIVGETDACWTLLLAGAGGRLVVNSKLASFNIMVNDESGVGKDYVLKCVLEMLPGDIWIHKTRISEKVLTYWHNAKFEPEWSWDGKVFGVEDISQNVLNSDVFKVFASSGSSAMVVINQMAVEVVVSGKPVQFVTSAKSVPSEENRRRFAIVNLDSGIEQTRAIIKRRAKFAADGQSPNMDMRYVELQRHLQRVRVKVPFSDAIADIINSRTVLEVIMRTHIDRIFDFVKASTALHQYQRRIDAEGFVLATKDDWEIARRALKKITSNARMIPLTKDDLHILHTIRDKQPVGSDENKKSCEFTLRELEIDITFLSDASLRERLRELADMGFLKTGSKTAEDTGRSAICYSYTLQEEMELPTWHEIAQEMQQSKLKK